MKRSRLRRTIGWTIYAVLIPVYLVALATEIVACSIEALCEATVRWILDGHSFMAVIRKEAEDFRDNR